MLVRKNLHLLLGDLKPCLDLLFLDPLVLAEDHLGQHGVQPDLLKRDFLPCIQVSHLKELIRKRAKIPYTLGNDG